MQLLTIGQMAKLNHLSEQTLRLYDRIGLFSPNHRGENGYRYYNIEQSALLDIIQYMKSLGISLKEIRHQPGSGPNRSRPAGKAASDRRGNPAAEMPAPRPGTDY